MMNYNIERFKYGGNNLMSGNAIWLYFGFYNPNLTP